MSSESLVNSVTAVLEQYGANLQTGLTTDQATQRREEAGSFNIVKPPINCPGWVCCLLPCIKNIPSMKAFSSIQPDDAEVLRNSKWIRYDPATLVPGDVIRIEEGDIVPADCILVQLSNTSSTNNNNHSGDEELLVDLRPITGEERLKSITTADFFIDSDALLPRLYMGGKVVQGGATAIISAIGPDTLLAKLIAEHRFPAKEGGQPLSDDRLLLLDDVEDATGGDLGIAMGDVS
jgi:E1-E2 ATPase/Cation transporter/ATPase, N-terminus